MSTPVLRTWRYRVKGARGRNMPSLLIKKDSGVAGDRQHAIRAPGRPSAGWKSKTFFRVCMTSPEMACQVPRFKRQQLDSAWLEEMAAVLNDKQLSVIDTGREYNMLDTNPFKYGPTVSFLNLATIKDLCRRTGLFIDPRRFRMNVWYDDGDPWSELAWANDFPGTREFDVGDIRFRMQDACERCEAINANPETGVRDLDLLPIIEAILKELGYAGSPHRGTFNVIGFLATPLSDGRLSRGQQITMQ